MKRTFKKAVASLTAVAIASASLAVTSFATSVTMSLEDEFTLDCTATETNGNIYQISMSDWDVPSGYYLSNVSFYALTEYDSAADWNGGGGGVALNFDSTGTWYDKAEFSLSWSDSEGQSVSVDIPYTFESTVEETTADGEVVETTVTNTQDIEGAISANGMIQFGWYWSATDTTLDISDIVLTFSLIEKDGEDVETPVEPEEPTTPDGVVGFTNSVDIEAAGEYWDTVVLDKEQLLGGINPYHVVAIVFESVDNFGIGYTDLDGTWTQNGDTNGYFEATDIGIFVDAQYFSMQLIGRIGSGTTTVSWTVYVTEQLVSDIAAKETFVMGSNELYGLNLFEVGTGNPSDVTSVVFNVTMTDGAWGWANANLYTNTGVWTQVSIGGVAYNEDGSQVVRDAYLEEGVAADVEVDFASDYWYQVGIDCYNGTFDINSITFMAGDEVYYTMEVLPLAEKLNGTSASIEDGVIGLNFFMSFGDDVLADEGAVLNVAYADGTVEVWAISSGEETENGYKYPVYVDAKEMADDVIVQVVMSDGTVGKEYTYSVKDYANTIIANEDGTYDELTVKLANAMLVYGGYAQTYFGYNTENLASEGLDTSVSAARVTSSYEKYTEGTLPEGVEYAGSSLVLNGTTKIRHYFTATDASVLPEGYTQKGDFYYYQVESIYADCLDDTYTTNVGDDWFIDYSALSYAYDVISNADSYSEDLVNLVKALRLLNVAANNYVA